MLALSQCHMKRVTRRVVRLATHSPWQRHTSVAGIAGVAGVATNGSEAMIAPNGSVFADELPLPVLLNSETSEPNTEHRAVCKYSSPAFYQSVRADIASSARTLPQAIYTSEDFNRVELNRLWGKEWFAACHTAAVAHPGDTKVVDVGDQSYIISRDRKGRLHGFHNVCIHRGSRLCSASKNRKRITCPYHQWTYGMDGKLMARPHVSSTDGLAEIAKDTGLFRVHVDTLAGLVWINASAMNESVPPLRDQMGDLSEVLANYSLEEFEVVDTRLYKPKCNWKLLAENFDEWYHINAVHPALAVYSRMEDHYVCQGEGNYMGFMTRPLRNCGSAADLDQFRRTPGITDAQAETAFFFHLFPNVCITLYPHSMYTLIMFPTEKPSESVEELNLLQHPAVKLDGDAKQVFNLKRKAVMDFVCQVNDEDVVICEKVQLGLKNKAYPGGMMSSEQELLVYRFQNILADKMNGVQQMMPPQLTHYNQDVAGVVSLSL